MQRALACFSHSPLNCKRQRHQLIIARSQSASAPGPSSAQEDEARATILEALRGVQGRGKSGLGKEQEEALTAAVSVLETAQGLKEPTKTEELSGSWRLLFTTQQGTASPIQRTFIGQEAFSVFQEIVLDQEGPARVNNVVKFGADVGYLKVEAEASTESRPIPGFVPRQGMGIPLFGKSQTYPPARPHMRLDFQFDRAAFYFQRMPFTIPYPVPFRLLGDETKGWIDITYLAPDGTFRLTRGNKGTLFVLQKEPPEAPASTKEKLLEAARKGQDAEVLKLIDQLVAERPVAAPAQDAGSEGTWRLLWSQQSDTATELQRRLTGSGNDRPFKVLQLIGDAAGAGRAENRVTFLPGLELRLGLSASPESGTRTPVQAESLQIVAGPLQIPLPFKSPDTNSFVDWLYLDEDMRVTRGNRGSVFIHLREESLVPAPA